MTRKSRPKPSAKSARKPGFPVLSWVAAAVESARKAPKKQTESSEIRGEDRHGRILILPVMEHSVGQENKKEAQKKAQKEAQKNAKDWLMEQLAGVPVWQRESAIKAMPESTVMADDEGPIWVLMPRAGAPATDHGEYGGGASTPSAYARTRDLTGACVRGFRDFKLKRVSIAGFGCTREHWLGALTGLDLGAYHFTEVHERGGKACHLPAITLPAELMRDATLLNEAVARALGVNTARHLVNLPPNHLNPERYPEIVAELFSGSKSMSMEILRKKDLEREGMGLLLGVGAGSNQSPCLIHLRYRPTKSNRQASAVAPIAFVGKGITFDSGGLDIKPSSGMRWMKKDMGGSAATVGLAVFVEKMALNRPMDFYLAVAENSVSADSMRPGDVLRARNGATVEIHNTDAEGRLVMADAIDYAVTRPGKDEPALLVDTSTLTGAMRVAVGLTISGMFASNDQLAEACIKAGQRAGDPCWRLPLFDEYKSALKSHAADFSNCSDSSFGGAITAALFLEKFTRGKPWIHFDFYGWADRARGAIAEPGGNGQAVQLLMELLIDGV